MLKELLYMANMTVKNWVTRWKISEWGSNVNSIMLNNIMGKLNLLSVLSELEEMCQFVYILKKQC